MRFGPILQAPRLLASISFSEEIEKSLSVLRLISTPVTDLCGGIKKRGILRSLRIDQTLDNAVQSNWKLEMALTVMTRCQISTSF